VLFAGGLPLLGGLGGLSPVNRVPDPARAGDAAALPPGGTPVTPGTAGQEPPAHAEPADGPTGGKRRAFTDTGRPIAGEDHDVG
jgi:hypothetical protein